MSFYMINFLSGPVSLTESANSGISIAEVAATDALSTSVLTIEGARVVDISDGVIVGAREIWKRKIQETEVFAGSLKNVIANDALGSIKSLE